MRAEAKVLAALAMVAVVFACSDDEGPPGTTAAPNGDGVCCPKDPSPCGPGYRGGWAASGDECVRSESFDGRFDERVDDHGCKYWQSAFPTGSFCCGCVTPPDASTD